MKNMIPLKHSVITVLLTLLLIISSVLIEISAFWGILGSIIVCFLIGKLNNFSLKCLFNMAINGIKDAYIVLIIMSLIGIIISCWMIGGTIPALMYYGFNYLSNTNFILATFLISSFISIILGTSIGTISTAGIPLMGIGIGLGVPPYITAGAIVSGAFFGDRTSPMSSSANLVSVITNTDLYENIKNMISTLIPVFLLSSIFYFLVGKGYTIDQITINKINDIKNSLTDNFTISPVLLLPPVIIMIMSFLRINIKYNLLVGIILGVIFALIYQDSHFLQIIKTSIFGFNNQDSNLNHIISGGGFLAMKGILSIVGSATALYGVLEGTNMIKPMIDKFINNITSVSTLILKTSILGILVNVITLNQTLAIIIPGKSMSIAFKKLKISKTTLARTIGDSATVVAPLIPWNINGLVIAVTLGTSVIKYAPYAILCYLFPIITIIFGFLGITKKQPQ